MRITRAALLAATLTLAAAPGAARAAEPIRDQATSQVELHWEGDARILRTVNTSFVTVDVWGPEPGERHGLLLRQEVDVTRSDQMEGPSAAAVRVEAWEVAPGLRKPAWRIDTVGEEAMIAPYPWSDDLYQVTTFGCCGARSVDTLYSLRNGQQLLTATAPVTGFEVPNAPVRRLVGVHAAYSQSDETTFAGHPDAVAILTYATPEAVLGRVLLTAVAPATVDDLMGELEPRIVLDKPGEEEGGLLPLWAANGRSDKEAITGLTVVLPVVPGTEVRIPIRDDALDLAAATVPPSIKLTPLAP